MRTKDWINTSRNRIFLDMHFPDWQRMGICSDFRTDEIAGMFSDSRVDSVILYAKCQYGNFYYDTRLGHKHSGLGDMDLFRALTAKLHEKDIKVIAYYSVNWDEYAAAQHPEWLVEGMDGTRDNLAEFRWSTLCINSPYRDIVLAHLKEIAETTGTDGFWLDMTIIGKDRCFCEYCRKEFRNRFGVDMPLSPEDKNWYTYKQWRYDYIEEFYAQAVDVIKATDSNIIVANNYWGYPYQSGSMGSRAVGALKSADFVTGEAYTDWTGLNAPGIFSKYLRGAGGGKPFEVLVGRFYNTWDYTVKSRLQMAYEAFTVIANGGTVTLDDEPYHDGKLEKEVYSNIKSVFDTVSEREETINGARPVKFAAILHSQATKDYLHAYGDVSFIPPVAGAYKVLRDLHLPVAFVFDENMEMDALNGYKMLIMPDTGCMDEKQSRIIREYVKNGGILISTYRTSLYDGRGGMTGSFGLAEVFGAEYCGVSEYSVNYIRLGEEFAGSGLATSRPYMFTSGGILCKPTAEAKVMAESVDPICETKGKTFFHNNQPAPYNSSGFPAIIANSYGKGFSFYFSVEIFSSFAKKCQREVKEMIKYLLTYAGVKPPVSISCPASAEVILNKSGRNKIILHIINPHMDLPVCHGHMEVFRGYYDRTLECMEDVIPLYNVKASVEIPCGRSVKKIKACEGPEIQGFVTEDRSCSFIIPEINLWQTVEIELQKREGSGWTK